jgi:hypothetical protein
MGIKKFISVQLLFDEKVNNFARNKGIRYLHTEYCAPKIPNMIAWTPIVQCFIYWWNFAKF